ncbi:HUS1 checkpoint protein [Sporothrix brasiliensis 5110]|uniref:Checkpoint protein n=1 Tax=Sporothrix brasiliensis 5110 TaxID=1398154 RepID=A0A0C2JDP0_9PEZI|nr:HUS1 checkpoint protein [Sporothrix brasiliensis 5110]KIH95052.1 HUS1 checkpoint protein [Sporothrix brasiliensis 5110]
MKFRAELRNIRTFTKLVAALSALDKIVWVHLEDDLVRFIVIPDRGSQVWSTFARDFFFDPDAHFLLQSLNAGNAIDLEITLASLQRALRSALNSTDAVLRLTKRDNVPTLSMTIHTVTNPRGLGAFGFGPIGQGGGGGGGASGAHQRFRESTFGSTFDDAAASGRDETLDLLAKREREKVVVQDMPVRVISPQAMNNVIEPAVPESDVNIVLPPLLQLKAVSDRFTKLAHTTSGGGGGGGSSSGLGLAPVAFSSTAGGGGGGMSNNTGGGGGAGPKLEISANMYGMLRLRLVTDTLSVETVWNDLENPRMNEDALPVPLEEHPSTRYREAGPDKFATVRVDGRDWSRVLSVGRLDGRVIACVVDGTALILHVYVSQPDDPDDPDEASSITYYVSSYST